MWLLSLANSLGCQITGCPNADHSSVSVGQGNFLNGCGDGRGQWALQLWIVGKEDETASKDPAKLHCIGESNERVL
jgi:hypothetical protein